MTIWPQWAYQYGVGGVFLFGALIAAWRMGAIRWNHRGDRRLLLALLAVYFAFLSGHAAWIALATR